MAEKSSEQGSNHPPACSKKTAIVWTKNLDLNLLRNATAEGVCTHRSGSREKGAAWQRVADNLATVGFDFNTRSVRDRFNVLSRKLKAKLSKEKRTTGGGEVETNESEGLLEELLHISEETERMAEEINETKKAEIEKEKKEAMEMRKRAMERMGETQKRSVEKEANTDESTKKRRRSSETVDWLKERVEMKKNERKEEMEHATNQHVETMRMMQVQQEQQMLQTQMFQQMIAQQQQEQQQQLIMVQQQMCKQ